MEQHCYCRVIILAHASHLTSFLFIPIRTGNEIKTAGNERGKLKRSQNFIAKATRRLASASQSRKPVRRRTALRTRRRSRPLSVLPAPSSTELCAAARRATISCGGTMASPSSPPPTAWDHLPLRAAVSDGMRTGADLAAAAGVNAAFSGMAREADRTAGPPARFFFFLASSSGRAASRPGGEEAGQRTSSSRRSPSAAVSAPWTGVGIGGRESRRRSIVIMRRSPVRRISGYVAALRHRRSGNWGGLGVNEGTIPPRGGERGGEFIGRRLVSCLHLGPYLFR